MNRNPAFQVFNGLAPEQSPKAMPINCDFTTEEIKHFDLMQDESTNVISFVQTIIIDNQDNDNELIIRFEQTGQRIIVPANITIIWPVVAPEKPRFTVETTPAAGLYVHLLLMNVPMPYSQLGLDNITVNASLQMQTGSFADKKKTLDGTSQLLIAANANRKRYLIQNPSTNNNSIWINFGAAATADNGGIELVPGGTMDSAFAPLSLQDIFVIGTNLETVAAKEM